MMGELPRIRAGTNIQKYITTYSGIMRATPYMRGVFLPFRQTMSVEPWCTFLATAMHKLISFLEEDIATLTKPQFEKAWLMWTLGCG